MGKDIPKQLDRYELVERIGQGGMGLIYRAIDTRLKRNVAIKIVSYESKDENFAKSAKERFLNEARAAGALSHSNLVQIYDFGEAEGHTYLVMEFIEGDTLEHILQQNGPINSDEVIRLAQQVASGLSYAHRRGIVHRDVKPSNVIVEAQSGVAKIVDFGIAKFIDDKELKMTSTGIVLGSTHYLSPEHIAGKNLDGRSDLYCLGTVLYEISTGSLPFRGSSASTILYKIVNTDPTPPSDLRPGLDPGLSQVITKLLRKNPEERFQTGEDLIEALKEIGFRRSDARSRKKTESEEAESRRPSFVRPAQLLSHLQAQKVLTAEQVSALRGKAVVPTLLKEALIGEDDLAQAISDCLHIPWFPRSRLKSLVVQSEALQFLSFDTMEQWNLLPFFFDEKKKALSVLIDGCSDFQRDPALLSLETDFDVKFYLTGRLALARLIQVYREKEAEEKSAQHTGPQRLSGANPLKKRILLIDDQAHHHEALIKLFRKNDGGLVIAPTQEEALTKLARNRFDYIWIQRSMIGDELAFEARLQKDYPYAQMRFFDHLGAEIFENSVSFEAHRDLVQRVLSHEWQKLPPDVYAREERLQQFIVALLRGFIDQERAIDEVALAFQLYRMSFHRIDARGLIQRLGGVFRFGRIFQTLSERFDGRGPNGLKGRQIPLAARIITAYSVFDQLQIDPTEPLSEEQTKALRERLQSYSGKLYDPELVTCLLDHIKLSEPEEIPAEVAIVDSDARFSQQLAAELKQLNIHATIYSDGMSALTGLKSSHPDLIITEILLAKMDGFSLCARVKADEILKSIPFLVLSQSQSTAHSTKALSLGADDFISKTQDRAFLMKKIERLVSSHKKKSAG